MAQLVKIADANALDDATAESLARNTSTGFRGALQDVFGSVVAGEVVAGGTVQVVEGAAWAVETTVTDGVATFKFTVPPGGVAWSKGTLPAGANLNTITGDGIVRADTSTIAVSIVNRPAEFVYPFEVETHRLSTINDIVTQDARMKIAGETRVTSMYRVALGGTWGPWRSSRDGGDLAVDAGVLAVAGDSQSEAAVAGSWDEFAAPLLAQTFDNQARSGDDTVAIGIRTGWIELLVTVAGGQIPASGAVAVQASASIPTRENRVLTTGSIAGVAGTLMYNTGGSFTFTRSTSGAAVAVSGPTRFVTSYSPRAATMLLWMGGNDFNYGFTGAESSVAGHVIAQYRQAVEWATKRGHDVVVAGVTNRLAAGPGTAGFAQVQRINDTLALAYPGRFLDVQGYYSQHALADAGLSPTQADLTAMAAGAIPPQLFLADGVHLTTAAHTAIGAEHIAPWLVAQGLGTAVGSVPAPKPLAPRPHDSVDAALAAYLAAVA